MKSIIKRFCTANETKFEDVYNLKKKLQKPNINNWLKAEKFTKGNVTLETSKTLKMKREEQGKEEKYRNEESITIAETNNLTSNKNDNFNMPIPVSPKLGPFEILNPSTENKSYHWCSCGMSKKQPFCDSSHKGTSFKPINFKVGEKVDKMLLCGCKLSNQAPFCDGATCIELKKKNDYLVNHKINIMTKH
jgi:CDGSH-type Zn-finger protein